MLFRAYYKGTNGRLWIPGRLVNAVNSREALRKAAAIYVKPNGDDAAVQVVHVLTLTCYHHHKASGELCGWVWQYSGRRTEKATCPSCFKQVDIQKAKAVSE